MANGHKNNITNMLGLKGFKVSDTREEEDAFVIEVQVKPNKTAVCPECNSKDLYRELVKFLVEISCGSCIMFLTSLRRCLQCFLITLFLFDISYDFGNVSIPLDPSKSLLAVEEH